MSNDEKTDYFLFLDLETTGEPDQKILEVGWMLTDCQLEPLFDCRTLTISQPTYTISDFILKMHTKNGLLGEVANTTTRTCDAETTICESIAAHPYTRLKSTSVILAGFSPHFDRALLKRNMPQLDGFLHYRHFDVSTLRGAYHYWVENIPSKKDEHPHRVKADVLASWEIAKTFRTLFQVRMPKLNDPEIAGMIL